MGIVNRLGDRGARFFFAAFQGGQPEIASGDIAAYGVQAQHRQAGFIQRRVHCGGIHIVGEMAFDRLKSCRFRTADGVGKGNIGPEEAEVG